MNRVEVARIVSPTEKEKKRKEMEAAAKLRLKLGPALKLTGHEDEYFAPPSGKNASFVAVEEFNEKMPSGVSGALLPLPEAQTYFPAVPPTVEISMDDKRYFAPSASVPIRTPVMLGHHYVDYGDHEILGITKKGEKYRVLNYDIRFLAEIREYVDDKNFTTAYRILVVMKGGTEMEFKVKKEDYSRFPDIIKKQMPGAFKHSQGTNAVAEYFARSYEERGNLPVETLTKYSGWFEIDDVIRYHVGTAAVYAKVVNPYNVKVLPENAVSDGLAFLAVGHNGPELAMVFLFAHVAYLRFWFERRGISFQALLYVVGSTGNLKTAVLRVLTNVLDQGGKLSNGIKITSSVASAKGVLEFLRDTFVLMDDYSKNNPSNNSKALKTRYDVTRYMADETVETKIDHAKADNIADTDFRAVVAFTGEDLMDVGESTELRTVTVEFYDDTVDEKLLTSFQQKDGPMLAYFSVFIQFLTAFGLKLERRFTDSFLEYRSHYGPRFPRMRRLADTAAQLRITVDVIREFAEWSGCGDIQPVAEIFYNAIDFCLTRQAKLTKSLKPFQLFVRALFESIAFGVRNPSAGVAESEAEYNQFPNLFIGYRDMKNGQEATCLRFDPAWQLVLQYFRKMGQIFNETERKIKEALLKNGIILGIPKTKGKLGVYSYKKGTEPRHHMTVFFMNAVNKILDEQEE